MSPQLSASVENYLETIFLLSEEKRVVRVKDIAKKMHVSMPSVNYALKTLKRKGLVKQERYGDIQMTPPGKERAERIYKKHRALVSFFQKILNVDEKIADQDACAIEHCISAETQEKLVQFISFFETCPLPDGPEWKKNFEYFCAHGERPDECHKKSRTLREDSAGGPAEKSPPPETISLTELRANQAATISDIDGGEDMSGRLEAMGIIPGAKIRKISDQLMHGPVTVQVGQTTVSIGFGMAQKIIVELNDK
ncbi:MAG: DtxR family transcriptional regulator [Pseudomonadota bacterium]